MKIQGCIALFVVGLMMVSTVSAEEVVLFDGTSMDEWKIVGDPEWKIEGDRIVVVGTGEKDGWLVTKRQFSTFWFSAKFKWYYGDSGIQIRSRFEGEDMQGFQCNLDPARTMATGSILELGGRGVLEESKFPAERLFREDRWNSYDIIAIGNSIMVVVNGKLTAKITDPAFP
ncbi:DUF1080 domain-containing protein, partial [bacterium]|nr:DUF1080 domain-containing protein [bacterium]